jgi:hypothetical protein
MAARRILADAVTAEAVAALCTDRWLTLLVLETGGSLWLKDQLEGDGDVEITDAEQAHSQTAEFERELEDVDRSTGAPDPRAAATYAAWLNEEHGLPADPDAG